MKYKYIAVCIEGLEEVAEGELRERGAVCIERITNGRMVFETVKSKLNNLLKENRSLVRVYQLIYKCEFGSLKGVCKDISRLSKVELQAISPFAVRSGECAGFNSQEVREEIGRVIYKKGYKVDLENPKTIIFVEIKNNIFFLGIDLTKKEFWKRDYLVQRHNQTVNPALAYCMYRIAKEPKVVLDPFCKDGVVAIECALAGARKVYATDSVFFNIKKAGINAKLAGLIKKLRFSKCDIDWIDTKFEKEMFDAVITSVPFPSKSVDERSIEKVYKEFFNVSNYVLKKKGMVVAHLQKAELFKRLCKFKLEKELRIKVGGLEQFILVYKK